MWDRLRCSFFNMDAIEKARFVSAVALIFVSALLLVLSLLTIITLRCR